MTTYRITSLVGGFGNVCPPPIVLAVFPSFAGWPCTLSDNECTVTVPAGITPADLGPLVKVEVVA